MDEELKVSKPDASAAAQTLFERLQKARNEEPDDQTQELLDRFNEPEDYDHCYAASVPGQCAVTVEYDDDYSEFFTVIVRMFNPDTVEGSLPDRWDIHWVRGKSIFQEHFWAYIDEHCPAPDLVRAAVGKLKLPEELKHLFEPVPLRNGEW
jgi:hypothetical protein